MIRKIMAALLALAVGIGLLVCVVGTIGVWVLNPPVTDLVDTTMQTTERYLVLALHTIDMTEGQIEEVRTQLDALINRIESMTPETRTAITRQGADVIRQRLGPGITTLRTTLAALRTGIVTLNHSLESANRIPGVNVPTLTEELQAVDQRLDELQANLTALTNALMDVSVDGGQLTALITATTEQLSSFEDLLTHYAAEITALREAIRTIDAAAPGFIDLSTVVLSALFILFGVGQVCLLARAIRAFQTN